MNEYLLDVYSLNSLDRLTFGYDVESVTHNIWVEFENILIALYKKRCQYTYSTRLLDFAFHFSTIKHL